MCVLDPEQQRTFAGHLPQQGEKQVEPALLGQDGDGLPRRARKAQSLEQAVGGLDVLRAAEPESLKEVLDLSGPTSVIVIGVQASARPQSGGNGIKRRTGEELMAVDLQHVARLQFGVPTELHRHPSLAVPRFADDAEDAPPPGGLHIRPGTLHPLEDRFPADDPGGAAPKSGAAPRCAGPRTRDRMHRHRLG